MVAQKNGVSAKGLQKILGLDSYQTAWTWLHKFRRLMVLSGRSKLQVTVEVDEVIVGGKKSGCNFPRWKPSGLGEPHWKRGHFRPLFLL